ncbi:MAG TPA: hypothetical protein VED19_00980 [Candidatus Nitrosopolaris sp.]|nr:hypothetical protein [Candidatus Nitrosopolaris sp.]
MDQIESSTEVQSPISLGGIIAPFACLTCMAYLFYVVSPAVELLGAGWAEMLVYTLIPIVLTFTILHGSDIHREMTRAGRAAFLFLVSCLIFGGTFLFLGVLVFCASAFPGIGRTGP